MFTWDHRVVRLSVEDENLLILAEVCYNEEGEPYGYAKPFTGADTVEQMEQLLQDITIAIRDLPVLDVATILAGKAPTE